MFLGNNHLCVQGTLLFGSRVSKFSHLVSGPANNKGNSVILVQKHTKIDF